MAMPEKAMNEAFWRMYDHAKQIIIRALAHASSFVTAEEKVVEAYNNAIDKSSELA
jgi:hypothetical protein